MNAYEKIQKLGGKEFKRITGVTWELFEKMLTELSTVKVLIERYVQKVIVSGENIEIQFNLNVSNRIVEYPIDTSKRKKEIPQFPLTIATQVFNLSQSSQMLATSGGEQGRHIAIQIKPP